jgi:hypothetical protein
MARKAKLPASFREWMHRHYDEFIDGAETRGTFCDEWVTAMCRDAIADTKASGADKALLQLISDAGRGMWDTDPRGKQFPMFSVAGVDIRHTYAFPDAHVPGGFRRVSGRYAVLRHAEMDAQLARAKADEALLAAAQKLADYRRIATRAGNDPLRLLWELRDSPPPSHPAPDGPRALA